MITKILIANRGEIACRIIHTAKKMGLSTVAIYSDPDRNALHTQLADIAYHVGAAPSAESYLNYSKIIKIAKQSGADAIHPGYGFLSENTEFAKACAENNIIFIGPPITAIAAMGSKSTAKKIMEAANIPLIPGYHGDNQDEDFLLEQASIIGFPIILKAAAGGGGKAMRIVRSKQEFKEAFIATKREAKAYFADEKLLLEKYLSKPRHIEMQIFADMHGNFVHLFERDCSIQRRHQKIIEEAPAPNLSESLRQSIATTAIKAAKVIHYVGAGTVEFLVDENNQFYFMEMNTRLQVEHPVTEMITKLDLVEWQIDVASGKVLPLKQEGIIKQGHAIEVRLYAEDPYHQFLPSTGIIKYLHWPEAVRIDTGFQENDLVSSFYDPMLAKLIVWGNDRTQAIQKMLLALKELRIVGINTNIRFLSALITQSDFKNGLFDTGFIETHSEDLFKPLEEPSLELIATIAIFHALQPNATLEKTTDPFSPWNAKDGWRLNLKSQLSVQFKYHETIYNIIILFHDTYYEVCINEDVFSLGLIKLFTDSIELEVSEHIKKVAIIACIEGYHVFDEEKQFYFEKLDPLLVAESLTNLQNAMTAPMPGTIIFVGIKNGDKVSAGAKLMTMEAMKMEHSIYAPSNGVVKELLYQVGDMVTEGAELLIFKAET